MPRIPDPNALRRDRKDDLSWTILLQGATVTPLPKWPLPGQTKREKVLWNYYWKKPQALLWRHNSQEQEVALFVRCMAEVEQPFSNASLHTLLLRQMDTLLLTIPAMYKARVKIVAADSGKKKTLDVESGAVRSSIRDRLKVVEND